MFRFINRLKGFQSFLLHPNIYTTNAPAMKVIGPLSLQGITGLTSPGIWKKTISNWFPSIRIWTLMKATLAAITPMTWEGFCREMKASGIVFADGVQWQLITAQETSIMKAAGKHLGAGADTHGPRILEELL